MAKTKQKSKSQKTKALKAKPKKVLKSKTVAKVKVVRRQETKKTRKQGGKTVRKVIEKKRIAIGGMAFSNGLMLRTHDNTVVALRDDIGKIEVFSFPTKSLRKKFSLFFVPFLRGIFFVIENIYLMVRARAFKKVFAKKILSRKPKYERIYAKTSRTFLYLIYILLFIGFFDYLNVRLGSSPEYFSSQSLYTFVLNLLYILFFAILFSILYFSGKEKTEILGYHATEHKVLNAYEKYGKVDIETIRKSSNLHRRCEIAVYFWCALFLAFSITFLRLNESGWMISLLVSVGLIFISFSFAYELVRLSSRNRLLSLIFIAPLYLLQYASYHDPDLAHEKLGEVAFNELIRLEKDK